MMCRGNDKQYIFLARSDRLSFLRLLDQVALDCRWDVFTYCLMNNHFHLVVGTPATTLAVGMKMLNGVYTQLFNARHSRVGHLYQGRYVSKRIEKDEYLLSLERYVLQNPVRAGLCREVASWEWSSYRATAGLTPPPRFLKTDLVLGFFSESLNPIKDYVEFVNGESTPGPWTSLTFNREVAEELSDLKSLIRAPHDKKSRDQDVLNAFENHGFSMSQIAAHLGLTPAAVSKIISRSRKEHSG